MDFDSVEIDRGGFSDTNPAQYDQKSAEAAAELQMADAYILLIYKQHDEEENGGSTSKVLIANTPGTILAEFLYTGAVHINQLILEIAQSHVEKGERNGEPEE